MNDFDMDSPTRDFAEEMDLLDDLQRNLIGKCLFCKLTNNSGI